MISPMQFCISKLNYVSWAWFLGILRLFHTPNEGKTWSHLYHVIPSFGGVKQTKNSKKSSSALLQAFVLKKGQNNFSKKGEMKEYFAWLRTFLTFFAKKNAPGKLKVFNNQAKNIWYGIGISCNVNLWKNVPYHLGNL